MEMQRLSRFPPKTNKCDKERRNGKDSGPDRRPGSRSAVAEASLTLPMPRVRDEIERDVSLQSIPSPFLHNPTFSTPSGPPSMPYFAGLINLQEQMRMQVENQNPIQQQMIQQQQNIQKLIENQNFQMQQNLQIQQQESVAKDNVLKEFIEESKRKEAQTREFLKMFQKQAISLKKIPCLKWSKE